MRRLDELKLAAQEAMLLEETTTTGVLTQWQLHNFELYKRIKMGDFSNFLRWPPILATMFAGGGGVPLYVQKELAELQDDSQWFRWKEVLQECDFGNPCNDANLIHQVYHAYVLENHMKDYVHNLDRVVEFGGGYGLFCKVLRMLGFVGDYTIIDTPVVSAIQRYYLSATGVKNVALTSSLKDIDKGRHGNAAFIANWSLSEVHPAYRDKVLSVCSNMRYYMIAYQPAFENIDNHAYFSTIHDRLFDADFKFKFVPSHALTCSYMLGEKCPT